MGEVKRFGNVRLTLPSNDHTPVHVHAKSPEHEAKFSVDCATGVVKLMENYGFKLRELRRIEAEIISGVNKICAEWRRIHGDQ